MRFKRTQHIRKSFDFKQVREQGVRIHGGPFLFCILKEPSSLQAPLRRLGVICSKKVGNAVIRNRAKRLLREVFRRNQESLPFHCDLVLIARDFIVSHSYESLKAYFIEACNRLSSRKSDAS